MPGMAERNNRSGVSFAFGTKDRRDMVLKLDWVYMALHLKYSNYPKDFERLEAQLRPRGTYAVEWKDREIWVDL